MLEQRQHTHYLVADRQEVEHVAPALHLSKDAHFDPNLNLPYFLLKLEPMVAVPTWLHKLQIEHPEARFLCAPTLFVSALTKAVD